jgi:hypothetical protein
MLKVTPLLFPADHALRLLRMAVNCSALKPVGLM